MAQVSGLFFSLPFPQRKCGSEHISPIDYLPVRKSGGSNPPVVSFDALFACITAWIMSRNDIQNDSERFGRIWDVLGGGG